MRIRWSGSWNGLLVSGSGVVFNVAGGVMMTGSNRPADTKLVGLQTMQKTWGKKTQTSILWLISTVQTLDRIDSPVR